MKNLLRLYLRHLRFNRYMVECEFLPLKLIGKPIRGFNRYMVECEYEQTRCRSRRSRSFNRYMVECESRQQLSYFPEQFVLIDTWWNVNKLSTRSISRKFAVLIDTWWNVNLLLDGTNTTICSFNRYMVECE